MKNSIMFKGSNGKLLIVLDSTIDFEQLKENLVEKLIQSKNFLMGYESVIQFKGRDISEDEELELLNIIDKTVDMNILYVTDGTEKEKEILEKNQKEPKIEEMIETINEGSTKFHLGTLRSGEILKFSGNIVVLGDVNPGSIIKATGNIIIMGTLNGIAHAGTKGNADAFIVASNMDPFQLKIDEILFKNFESTTAFTSKQIGRNKNNIAYLRNDMLIIDKLTKKSLKNIAVV